jgi:hypothetical protein
MNTKMAPPLTTDDLIALAATLTGDDEISTPLPPCFARTPARVFGG